MRFMQSFGFFKVKIFKNHFILFRVVDLQGVLPVCPKLLQTEM
jgi:hypothetical protein